MRKYVIDPLVDIFEALRFMFSVAWRATMAILLAFAGLTVALIDPDDWPVCTALSLCAWSMVGWHIHHVATTVNRK